MEASASWKVEALGAFDRSASELEPRLETTKESDVILQAIGATLESIRLMVPRSLAVAGVGALMRLPAQSQRIVLAAPHTEVEVEWLPGDEDFRAGESHHSMIVDFGETSPSLFYPCFLGLDPRCLLLFSESPISPRTLGSTLEGSEGHVQALERILAPKTLAAFPALDGDVIVFVGQAESFVSTVMGKESPQD